MQICPKEMQLNINFIYLSSENDLVKDIDMLHANDYSSMSLGTLKATLTERKNKDDDVKRTMK